MIRNSILRNSAIQFVVLTGIMIFAMTGVSYAQAGATAGQPPPRQEDAASGQESSLPKNDSTTPGQGTSNQSGFPSVSLPSNQEPGLDESPVPEPESLFHKIIRIFFGPNSPPGPNPDVDTNISAGGAGGG